MATGMTELLMQCSTANQLRKKKALKQGHGCFERNFVVWFGFVVRAELRGMTRNEKGRGGRSFGRATLGTETKNART